MIDWKQFAAGLLVGAVLGIFSTLFLFQNRISRLEAQLEQQGESSPPLKPMVPGFQETAGRWQGRWGFTATFTEGSFSGDMELYVDGSKARGWCDNTQGGTTELEGSISDDGEELSGTWTNKNSGQQGTMIFRLETPTMFRGNYTAEGEPISPDTNEWTGVKK